MNKVIYIPLHLLLGDKSKMVEEKNLGIVTSKNDVYVFVRFIGNENSQAVSPDDLYFIFNRPDLEKLIEDAFK